MTTDRDDPPAGRIEAAIVRSLRGIRRVLRPGSLDSAQRRRRANVGRGEEGGALVEFALTVPILLSFFFGLIEVCMALYMHQVLSECAREGTRYAMVRGSTCVNGAGTSCTTTAAAVNSYVSGLSWPNIGGAPMTVSTTFPDGNLSPGSRVQVYVTYPFPYRVPFVPPTTLNMSSTSVTYIVQ
jgi:Flp pilus assembly protein TadG